MSLTVVTAPTVDLLTLAETKLHLRQDHAAEDSLITALIAAATGRLDGRDGVLNRALLTQTWALRLPGFPVEHREFVGRVPYFGNPIALPLPPVQSITSIQYVDGQGNTHTLAADQYQLVKDNCEPLIYPSYGNNWPTTRDQPDAVTVTFVAGYGAAASNVPTPIKQAALLMIGHWFTNRESVTTGVQAFEVPQSAEWLLAPFKVYSY